jgi:hypothetical protein
MKHILTAILVLVIGCGQSQVNWQQASNWRLYRVTGNAIFSISVDSLSRLKSYPLRTDSMAGLLDSVGQLPADVKPAWMGGKVATCICNGKTRKILISDYAGYFYDQLSGTYFQLSPQKKDEWMDYINSCVLRLL